MGSLGDAAQGKALHTTTCGHGGSLGVGREFDNAAVAIIATPIQLRSGTTWGEV